MRLHWPRPDGARAGTARALFTSRLEPGLGAASLLTGSSIAEWMGRIRKSGITCLIPLGPECSCGFRGCWESLAAGPAMVAWMDKHAPVGYLHRQGITAKRICELAKQGDELAAQAVEHEGHYLGLGLANLITMFTPDAIVLSGSVMKSAPLFMGKIREVIRGGCRFVPAEKTELMLASLGEDTNLIGAARVWHYRFDEGRATAL